MLRDGHDEPPMGALGNVGLGIAVGNIRPAASEGAVVESLGIDRLCSEEHFAYQRKAFITTACEECGGGLLKNSPACPTLHDERRVSHVST
jgi:hypothetical protein